ncbi:uncharacterized protein DS421_14g458470 [Arachis hypogaea]|nr:uncharacterized protein DS421_14g458470 [Arachis hypogaea]
MGKPLGAFSLRIAHFDGNGDLDTRLSFDSLCSQFEIQSSLLPFEIRSTLFAFDLQSSLLAVRASIISSRLFIIAGFACRSALISSNLPVFFC